MKFVREKKRKKRKRDCEEREMEMGGGVAAWSVYTVRERQKRRNNKTTQYNKKTHGQEM